MGRKSRRIAAVPATAGLAAALAFGGLTLGATAASADEASTASATVDRPDAETVPYFGWRLRVVRDRVVVRGVAPDGPADDAGIEARDIVVSVDGVALDERGALREAMSGIEPGDTVAVVVSHDGAERSVRVTTGSQADRPGPEEHPYLGVTFERPASASTGGVVLASVTPGSPAEDAGLKKGDTITKVDGISVANVRELATHLRELAPGDTVSVAFERDGRAMLVSAVLGSQADNPTPPRDRLGPRARDAIRHAIGGRRADDASPAAGEPA